MADSPPDAFEAALGELRRKELTTAELVAWLRRRGCDGDRIRTVIAGLVEAGELDDELFGRRYAEDKRTLSGWGPERIREALASRGVPEDSIAAALSDDTEAAQVARAGELLAARGRPLAEQADRARALGFLTRRGYAYEVAHEAIQAAARIAS